ncbi:MAG: pesticidal protein Cry7Aa [bacterium]|nr:pesticidal protein Cry7Aa [bacterium]
MIRVEKHGVILKPTKNKFENKSVFNPGILQVGEEVHVIYRALDKDNVSSLGYARLIGPTKVVERWTKPFMYPEYKYEKYGIEDARVVKINNNIYLTYVVHDGKNALVAYSSGKDLFNLKKKGIISPQFSYDRAGDFFSDTKLKDKYFFFKSYYKDGVGPYVKVWDKDAFFFPEKIKGRFALVHRILPDIQVAYADSLNEFKKNKYWKQNLNNLHKYVILESLHHFEARNIGGGAPPIKTKEGWLMIYHGVEPLNHGRVYHAGAALLSKNDPTKTIARLPYPLFSPNKAYEHQGHVHNVVFPTGTAVFKDRLYIYYGAADSYVAVASVNLHSLVKEILKYKKGYTYTLHRRTHN